MEIIAAAWSTALFGALVFIFFTVLMLVLAVAISLVGLLVGFVMHLVDNARARKLAGVDVGDIR